jgi:serine protease Do
MGYSIPISNAKPMIDELMNRETVSSSEQGFLGVNGNTAQNVTADYAERFNMPVGIYINDVIENSPAAKAGLVAGDIITGVDDVKVETIDDLIDALSYKKAGQEIILKFQTKKNGAYIEKSLSITLADKN